MTEEDRLYDAASPERNFSSMHFIFTGMPFKCLSVTLNVEIGASSTCSVVNIGHCQQQRNVKTPPHALFDLE